jgi:hypothetical protein
MLWVALLFVFTISCICEQPGYLQREYRGFPAQIFALFCWYVAVLHRLSNLQKVLVYKFKYLNNRKQLLVKQHLN